MVASIFFLLIGGGHYLHSLGQGTPCPYSDIEIYLFGHKKTTLMRVVFSLVIKF